MASLGLYPTRMTIPTLVQRAQQSFRMADLGGFSLSLRPLFWGQFKNPSEPLMIVEPEISRCRRSAAGTDFRSAVFNSTNTDRCCADKRQCDSNRDGAQLLDGWHVHLRLVEIPTTRNPHPEYRT
jgi:hypothetical protein